MHCTGSGSRLLKPGLTPSDPQMTAAVVPAQNLASPSSPTLPRTWAGAFSLCGGGWDLIPMFPSSPSPLSPPLASLPLCLRLCFWESRAAPRQATLAYQPPWSLCGHYDAHMSLISSSYLLALIPLSCDKTLTQAADFWVYEAPRTTMTPFLIVDSGYLNIQKCGFRSWFSYIANYISWAP